MAKSISVPLPAAVKLCFSGKLFVLATAACIGLSVPAFATSGPGCLRVVNVADWDVLNIRSRPSAGAPIVGELEPGNHGIISLRGECRPKDIPLRSRWCPVTVYDGDDVIRGWVKARFVRDSDCP